MPPLNNQTARFSTAAGALVAHWPEYLMEGAELGLFMVSACFFTVLLFHPASPVAGAISDGLVRRILMGLAMGTTAIVIIYSPIGARSGAHMNPAVTLTFLRLGRIARWDAFFYICAQLIGSAAGVAIARALLGVRLAHPAVNYAVTVPGMNRVATAAVAEFAIAFILMTVVLNLSDRERLMRFTGIAAGVLVFIFITVEAPLSGMSMNPARTFGSALNAHVWTEIWIYFLVPPIAMLGASETFLIPRRKGCAKVNHASGVRCIFCDFRQWTSSAMNASAVTALRLQHD